MAHADSLQSKVQEALDKAKSMISRCFWGTETSLPGRAAQCVAALWGLPIYVVDRGLDTAGVAEVNGKPALLISVDYLLDPELRLFELVHEGSHVFAEHLSEANIRAKTDPNFDSNLYNIACDAWINTWIIKGSGIKIPEGRWTYDKVSEETGVPLYNLLQTMTDWWDLYLLLQREAKRGKWFHPGDGDVPGPEATMHEVSCTNIPVKPLSPENASKLGNEAKWKAKQAAENMRRAGRDPGMMLDEFIVQSRGIIDWRQYVFNSLAGIPITYEERWLPPPRWLYGVWHYYHPYRPLYPAEYELHGPRVAACVDVSGSISEDLLTLFLSGVADLATQLKAQVTVVPWDVRVYEEDVFDLLAQAAFRKVRLRHGGGTTPTCVVDFVKTRLGSVDAVVVFTDMCFFESPEEVYSAFMAFPKVFWVAPAGINCVDIGRYSPPPPTQVFIRFKYGLYGR